MSSVGFSLRGLLFLVVAVPATLLASLAVLIGGLMRAPRGFHDRVQRWWSRTLLAAAGVEVRVSGEENLEPGGAQVLACNHQSMFDILVLMATVPASVRFVAKAEIASVPVFAGAMRSSGHVFIDRTNPRHAITRMRSFGDRMRRDGLSVVVFPEGTRSRDGTLRRFKRAPFLLAIEADAPVLPVAVEGGGDVMPKGTVWTRPGRMSIRIGPALATDGLDSSDRGDLAECAHDRVADLLEQSRERG
ncbi:MAG: lysophospholipid acyltransferase family protein [Candidatus Palauibacterales bacterium]|nr:lysophospholipid acyltransferase family protein [Candidatus Palauibacterales bacterium]